MEIIQKIFENLKLREITVTYVSKMIPNGVNSLFRFFKLYLTETFFYKYY